MFPDTIDSVAGIILIGLLWIGISNKYLLLPISLFAVVLIAAPHVIQVLPYTWIYNTLWAIGGVGLLVSYFFRYKRKSDRSFISYMKFSAVSIFSLFLFPVAYVISYEYQTVWAFLVAGYVVVVYTYDRFQLIHIDASNRKFVIALVIQTVLLGMFLIYALVQRTQAIKSREEAVVNQQEATRQKQVAMEHMVIAERTQALAEQQAEDARKALKACQKSK